MASPIRIQVKRKAGCEDIPLPRYMSPQAAGMDICAACDGEVTIAPGEVVAVPAGFSLAVPEGHEAQVRARSGLALRHGIIVPNAPSTIDADYRGEVCVILANIGREPFTVRRGMRIAQMVICPVARAEVVAADALGPTARGDGGFGHTGM